MPDSERLRTVLSYHDATKHHVNRFARSLGYLDWASQPRPFRAYDGAAVFALYPTPGIEPGHYTPPAPTYGALFAGTQPAASISAAAIGDLLRHSLGLSAWKRYGASRWSLRVNPSSGNLHPTEAYVVAGATPGLADTAAVYHYAPDRHALELRCAFPQDRWLPSPSSDVTLVALTSIHWREAWKYGERAFRYCQHDIGHAIAAVRVAGALLGWRAVVLPDWPQDAIGRLVGAARDEDYFEAEREEPACVLALGPGVSERFAGVPPDPLVGAVSEGRWSGRASQLSEDHVTWSIVNDVADATSDPGRRVPLPLMKRDTDAVLVSDRRLDARRTILSRRSAVAFDAKTAIPRDVALRLLSALQATTAMPFDALWWSPRIHLLVFIHRVDGLEPGLYFLPRHPQVVDRLKAACAPGFAWEEVERTPLLFRLASGDSRAISQRLSCDQNIAGDGMLSLAMLADFDGSLDEFGPSFYRHLFWEAGAVGQAAYLEAEAAGIRGTGIGCFYDDAVHELLGLKGHAFQSLYHFTVGMAVDDVRLTTEAGYEWER